MSRFKGRRPSPVMIVTGVVLAIALAGTAIAGPSAITSALNKSEKKQVKKIAKNQVNKLASGLSVGNSDKLDQLDSKQVSPAADSLRTADLALGDNFADVTTATITVAAPSKLVANAVAHLSSNGGNNDRGSCRLIIDGTAGIDYSQDVPAGDATLPVIETRSVAAGTHTVTLSCLKNVAGVVSILTAEVTVEAHLE